jgi:hypothetical protein
LDLQQHRLVDGELQNYCDDAEVALYAVEAAGAGLSGQTLTSVLEKPKSTSWVAFVAGLTRDASVFGVEADHAVRQWGDRYVNHRSATLGNESRKPPALQLLQVVLLQAARLARHR